MILPENLNKLRKLKHLLVSHNMLSSLPDLPELESLDVYSNKLSSLTSSLSSVKRLDLAENNIVMKDVKISEYLSLELSLRSWSGIIKLSSGVDVILEDLESLRDRVSIREETVEQKIVELQSDDDSDMLDDKHNCDNIDECLNVDDEVNTVQFDEEVWSDCEPYDDHTKMEHCYDLSRMDRERWGGDDKFCPADQHQDSVRSKTIVAWDRDRLRRLPRDPDTRPSDSCHPGQFDDAGE